MKKLINLILISLISMSVAHAQSTSSKTSNGVYTDVVNGIDTLFQTTKSAVTTVYEDSKDILPTVYSEVKGIVVTVAKALGVAAEHVYSVLVMQSVVYGVSELLIFVLGIITFIFSCITWRKYHKNYNGPITYKIIPSIILFILSIVIFYVVDYTEMLIGLINPEYGAISYILEYGSKLIK